tara:strand:- start:484 stop:666 length:183 start_codon:yes stop_codon:yes gene_type:complete
VPRSYGVDEIYSRVSYHAKWVDKIIVNDVEFIEQYTTQHHFSQEGIEGNLVKACTMIGFK